MILKSSLARSRAAVVARQSALSERVPSSFSAVLSAHVREQLVLSSLAVLADLHLQYTACLREAGFKNKARVLFSDWLRFFEIRTNYPSAESFDFLFSVIASGRVVFDGTYVSIPDKG